MIEKICEHCGKTIETPYPRQKYHHDCAVIVNRASARRTSALVRAGKLIQPKRSKYDNLYELIDLVESPFEKLAMAIVVRACIDWKELCDDATLPNDCNFDEMERFLMSDECDTYLESVPFCGEDILKILQRDRFLAGK